MRLLLCLSFVLTAACGRGQTLHGTAGQPEMQARVLGEGRVVILVGGGLLGADGWGGIPSLLAQRNRVVNLQSLAVQYGLEERPLPEAYSIATEATALSRTLDQLNLRSVDIIGMSHGAVIALEFALRTPERVRTLTLIEPPAFWVLPNRGLDDEGSRSMQELLRGFRRRAISEEDLERFRCALDSCAGGNSPRSAPQWPRWLKYRNSLRALYTIAEHKDDPARLTRLGNPVLIVTGSDTVAFHRRINRMLLQLLPRATELEVRGGHNSPVVSPDQFLSGWRAFCEHHKGR